jgi:PAS domain S-box-containing protein
MNQSPEAARAMANQIQTLPPVSSEGEPIDRAEAVPPVPEALHRQLESLRERIEGLGPGPDPASEEVYQALASTMEELRVAVEELRQTNDALRDSRADVEAERRRYRELFDLAPDPYLVTNLQGVIREANRAASVVLNIDHQFLVGKPLVVFLPREGRMAFRSELARAREATGIGEYDLRLKPRKLPPIDAAVRVAVVRDQWGQPAALRWTARDVSARKRAEEKIRALNDQLERRVVERSEQLENSLQANERWLIKAHAADAEARLEGRLFQDLVEEVDAILWRADAETGRYTFVSRRAEELLGYPASSWIDNPDFWAERLHPEDREWAIAHRRKQLREGLDHEAEYRLVAADGHALWFRESVRVLRPGPDRPAMLCGLMVNISKRKKVERQLYSAKGELALRLRDMTYLHELGGRLATARGWRATLDEVLSAVTSLQGTDQAMVLIREPEGGTLAVAASVGLPEEFLALIARSPIGPGGPLPRLASAEPVTIEDTEAEAEPGLLEAAKVGGLRALAGVPLFTREGVHLGAIVTGFRAPYRASEGQARLVEMYAEHAAEAIEAARLLDRLEQANRGKSRALAEMRTPLVAILNTDKLDPDTARELIERQARALLKLLDGLADPG